VDQSEVLLIAEILATFEEQQRDFCKTGARLRAACGGSSARTLSRALFILSTIWNSWGNHIRTLSFGLTSRVCGFLMQPTLPKRPQGYRRESDVEGSALSRVLCRTLRTRRKRRRYY